MSNAGERPLLQNALSVSKSPYLRQHQTNPVAWQEWTPQTLSYAKDHDFPIFLSIGYSACHWCHVMEHESFSNQQVAKALNSSFISIKVDREERPDVDRIYMNFVTALTGSGGWPLNVFLTPNALPIFGGTYWPGPGGSTFRGPDFLSVVSKMENMWKTDKEKVLSGAVSVTESLRQMNGDRPQSDQDPGNITVETLKNALVHFQRRFDSGYGGFTRAPKFPNEVNISYLLAVARPPKSLRNQISEKEKDLALMMATETLTKIADGGIHDHIGHGFARYSVTRDWSLPHFEKMSYTNSLLMNCYLDAWLITKDNNLMSSVVDIAEYFTKDALLHKRGDEIAFYSAEDADSRNVDGEKKEGAFYVWSKAELDIILNQDEAELAASYWNVRKDGNVASEHDSHEELTNQNVLCVIKSIQDLAKEFSLSEGDASEIMERAKSKLLKHRTAYRQRPQLDDKILTSWNGLAITALACTAAATEHPYPEFSQNCLQFAEAAAKFIKKYLYDDTTKRLKRVYSLGSVGEAEGLIDDYANMISACIALYEATFDGSYIEWAADLQQTHLDLFYDDTDGGFFVSPAGSEDLILRLKDDQDGAEPAANSTSVSNLFKLSAMLPERSYLENAEGTIYAFRHVLHTMGIALPEMLKGAMMAIGGVQTIVVHGMKDGSETREWLSIVRDQFHPGRVVIFLEANRDRWTPAGSWLVEQNTVLQEIANGKPGVYICEGFSCGLPIIDPAELIRELD
ncbi:hypothetical protein ABW20_dc0104212 [Dactylellina cionopaga]|nr:hypothetical protein ABW20_dc0104212 [Dactylellina cionopaga]